MIVIRYAQSDPSKADLRSALLEKHKRHIRNAPFKVVLSGPAFQGNDGNSSAAVMIAETGSFEEIERFSAEDPYVASGVYTVTSLYEWRPSYGSLLDNLGS